MYIAYVIINFTHLAAWTEKNILTFELVCLIVFKVSPSINVKDWNLSLSASSVVFDHVNEKDVTCFFSISTAGTCPVTLGDCVGIPTWRIYGDSWDDS